MPMSSGSPLDVASAAVVAGSGAPVPACVSAAVLVSPSAGPPDDVVPTALVPCVVLGSRPGASAHADDAITSTATIRVRMANGSTPRSCRHAWVLEAEREAVHARHPLRDLRTTMSRDIPRPPGSAHHDVPGPPPPSGNCAARCPGTSTTLRDLRSQMSRDLPPLRRRSRADVPGPPALPTTEPIRGPGTSRPSDDGADVSGPSPT